METEHPNKHEHDRHLVVIHLQKPKRTPSKNKPPTNHPSATPPTPERTQSPALPKNLSAKNRATPGRLPWNLQRFWFLNFIPHRFCKLEVFLAFHNQVIQSITSVLLISDHSLDHTERTCTVDIAQCKVVVVVVCLISLRQHSTQRYKITST